MVESMQHKNIKI